MGKILKAVTFSFDDGVVSDKKLLEVLNKYNMKCTFNINSGLMSGEKPWRYNDKFDVFRIDKSENFKEIYKGHEIAVHGTKHLKSVGLTDEQLREEFYDDKAALESMFDCDIEGMAYAFGKYDDKTVDYLRKIGIKYGRTVKSSYSFDLQSDLLRFQPTCKYNDDRLMDLCEKFIKADSDKPQIFYVWGHAYEPDADNNMYIIENLCRELADKDFYLGTNSEVFRYFDLI